MSETVKPFPTAKKKLFTGLAVFATGAALLLSQNITNVQASDEQDFVTVASVSAGNTFATLLTTDGAVYSRGWNSQGQLGFAAGQQVSVTDWEPVLIEEKVTEIDSPYDHTVALGESGHLYTWGPNDVGQSGNGTTSLTYTPSQVKASLRYEQISAGENFVVAIDAENRLWSWGANDSGQLGDGTTDSRNTPALVSTSATFTQVSAGKNFVIAVDVAGNIQSWGANDSGQLGDGTTDSRNLPAEAAGGTTWSKVATNIQTETVLATDINGRLYSWGSNSNGQLGNGTDWRAEQVTENERVERLIAETEARDAARRQNLIDQCITTAEEAYQEEVARITAVNEDRTRNAPTSAPTPTPTPSPSPSATPKPSSTATPTPTPTPSPSVTLLPIPAEPDYKTICAAQVDETFKKTDTSGFVPAIITEPALQGNSATPVLVSSQLQFFSIALGTQNGYAVDSRDRLYAWGSDVNGQTGLNIDDAASHTQVPVQIQTSIESVTAGDKYAAAVGTNGDLFVWGENSHGELLSSPATEPKLLTPTKRGEDFASVTAGISTVYGQKGSTTVAWGDNSSGQLGANSTEKTSVSAVELTNRLRSVAPYSVGAVGLDLSNQLAAWGENTQGEFGTGETSDTIAPAVGIKVVDTFRTAKAGYLYSLAVDTTGQLWGWGESVTNLIGTTNAEVTLYPVAVPIGVDIQHVAAGKTVAVASNESQVFIWGEGLGLEVQEYDLADVKQLAAGSRHVLVLLNDGTLWNWGSDSQGVLNMEEQRTLSIADLDTKYAYVAAGNGSTLALTMDGKLTGWGDNTNNVLQLDENSEITQNLSFVNVSLNATYGLGVDENGVVWGWGYSPHGVFGLPSVEKTPAALPLTLTNEGN